MEIDAEQLRAFRERIWDYYRDYGRDLPWRHEPTPYQVFVSEVMLQQTQVSRVLERYPRWLKRFVDFEALAAASVAEALAEWQGLGYNRRALWLRAAAERVVNEWGGQLPRDPAQLVTLPGVGPNTAGSIAAFAYDEPTVFIETNIRRVFLHEFLGDREGVADAELRPLIAAALDREQPRQWYYALMDYGAALAKQVPNPNRRSKHYNVQSKFEGSLRQLRGEVLRQLLAGPMAAADLTAAMSDERLPAVMTTLVAEGFVVITADGYRLA
ncbi:MAG TPA: A/G-specific adenine glycosylase [Candidatus Saccharimonadia bacterium]|nr:A/G-specific adenine glycosylase [Candidatus Saccharimonadia bacterium]